MDLLEQKVAERLDAAPQERAVEGDVDALERDGGEAALEVERLRLRGRLLGALADDGDELGLDFVEGEALHQVVDVEFLGFEVVGDVGEAVEGAEVAGADVLHVSDVVVDDFEQEAGFFGNVFDDVLQRLLVEGLGDSRWVHGTHAVVGTPLFVALDGDLHREAAVEYDCDQALDGHDFGQGCKGRVLAERMPCKAAVTLHQAFGAHVLEAGLFHEGESGLGKLGSGEQAGRRAVGVGGCILIDFLEDLLRLDGAVRIDGLKRHGHVILADGFATRATKMNREFFGIVFDNICYRKA